MNRLMCATLAGFAMTGVATAQPVPDTQVIAANTLTRDEAIARAMNGDPGVAAAIEGVRAAEASARQARLRPNPSLDVQLEDFGGSGSVSGLDGAQATYSLSQEFELGGDRRARSMLADRETGAARIRAGLSELDLREAVELAFVEAQAAEALVSIAQSRLEVAKDFAAAVDRRVRAARDPEAARARVSARLAETEIEMETAKARVVAAKAALASYWGGGTNFSVETEKFFSPTPRNSSGESSPDIALAAAERDSAAARVDIERAKRVPDPSVRAGFRQLRDVDESAFIVGVSVPLPIWNRNSGAIAAAQANKRRAELQVSARERELAREIAYLFSQSDAARNEVQAYAERIIPSSEQAVSQSLHAYRQGGLSYIEVLDAQTSLAEARMRQISALLTYHRSEAKLARRMGALSPDTLQENSQ